LKEKSHFFHSLTFSQSSMSQISYFTERNGFIEVFKNLARYRSEYNFVESSS